MSTNSLVRELELEEVLSQNGLNQNGFPVAARLLPGCFPVAVRLLSGCFLVAFQNEPAALRLLPGCFRFAFRLLSGCLPAAFRLLSGCFPDALRQRAGCAPVAFRLLAGCSLVALWLLSGCFPVAFRLLPGCFAVAFRLLSGCCPVAFRLLTGCSPLAFRLLSGCVPVASRLRSGCFPVALRLLSESACFPVASRLPCGCFPVALRLPSGCFPVASRLLSACCPAAFPLVSGCFPVAFQLSLKSPIMFVIHLAPPFKPGGCVNSQALRSRSGEGGIWEQLRQSRHGGVGGAATKPTPRGDHAFAWQGLRIMPGRCSLTQPAGPPGGTILRTGFWAQIPAQILDRVPCTSQWGAGHAVPDSGPESGPKIRSPKSGLAMGGASAFFMPRALNHVRLLHSIIDFISHGWATVC